MNTICADKMLEDMRGIPPPAYAVFTGEKSNRDEIKKESSMPKQKKLMDSSTKVIIHGI